MSAPRSSASTGAGTRGHVERLLAPALAAGWAIAWWALDRVAPRARGAHAWARGREKLLAPRTSAPRCGSARGRRWVVLSDDDIAFVRGTSSRSSRWRRAPASASRSRPTRPGSRGQPRHHARAAAVEVLGSTTFVEGGPCVAIAPAWTRPRDAAPGLARGWAGGSSSTGSTCAAEGCRLGIVDAVQIIAPRQGRRRRTTTRRSERAACATSSRNGASRISGPLQRTLATWRPWQRRPLVGGRLMRLPLAEADDVERLRRACSSTTGTRTRSGT